MKQSLSLSHFFLCGVIPEIADLGVEAGLNVALDEGIHDTHEQNADHDADDDPDGLVDIELGFGIGNGILRLAVDFVALVVDGFLRAVEEILCLLYTSPSPRDED